MVVNNPPAPSRPYIAHKEYGIPKSVKGILDWSHVVERMEKARNYWVATVHPSGRPHTVPVWGVWVDNTAYFGGGPETRWSRNLKASPEVAVHLESGDDVLILEGTVGRIENADHPLMKRIDDAYEQKYQMRHGPPLWVLHPRVILAWTQFPKDATRWKFE
jgi:hypothetical protein